MGHRQIPRAFKWLWETFCQPKHKVFFWLLVNDRLSTRNRLRRRNMQLESFHCVLCQLATEETLEHLFLSCPFASECWNKIGVTVQTQHNIFRAIQSIRRQTHPQFFYDSYNSHVLVHLDSKKQSHLRRNSSEPQYGQSWLRQRIKDPCSAGKD